MRIAYLSGSKIPSESANSIQVMWMCEAFANEGHDVTLIAQEGNGQDAYETYGVRRNFEIIRYRVAGSPRLRQWRYGWQAVSEIRRLLPVDVIYGRHLPGLAMASFLRAPIVYEVHEPARRTSRMIERWLFRRPSFSQLTTTSAALRREYLQSCPALAVKAVLVSANAARVCPPDSGRQVVDRGERLQIGYTGHLYPGKGMEMVARLASRLSNFDFHVVGGTGDELKRWQARVNGYSNLTLHGHVAPAQVGKFQREMDVLILPCQTTIRSAGGADIAAWTSPLKLFEYLAASKPVVASDLPVLREVLQDGENALLAAPDDIDAWRQKLNRLLDPRFREELGQRARKSIEDRYNWDNRARRVLQMIEDSFGQ